MESPPRQSPSPADDLLHVFQRGLETPESVAAGPFVPQIRREHLAELHNRWRVTPQPFSSSVPILGRFISAFRTLWNNVATKWYLHPILQQQVDFNATAARFASQLDSDVRVLEARMTDADHAVISARRDLGVAEVHLLQQQRQLQDLLVRLEREEQMTAPRLTNLEATMARRVERLQEMEQYLEQMEGVLGRRIDTLAGDVLVRLTRLERRATSNGDQLPQVPPASSSSLPDIPSVDYLRFEQRFRGPSEGLREQQRAYLPYFAGASDVLDIGCGRGEFMELLREQGVSSIGVDLDADMVAACVEKGLDAKLGDALEYLRGLPDAWLGGAFSAQVVEHLTSSQLAELTALLGRKLRPGAPVVIETINPMSLVAANSHFLLDLSHTRLVHPETLKFLLECADFGELAVQLRSPAPESIQLEHVSWPGDGGVLDEWALMINRNIDRLNGFLYGYQDYAVVGRKLDMGAPAEQT